MNPFFSGTDRILLAVVIVLMVAITGCITSDSDPLSKDWRLTVNGSSEKVLTLEEIRSLPSVTGHGYAVSTTGARFGPYLCKGVDVRDLAILAGGIHPGQKLWISAPDGYLWVFDYDQLNGEGFVTFDQNLTEIPAPALRIILVYERDGAPLSYDDGGPAGIAIISEHQGIVTEGSAWVKWVDRIEIRD